MRERIVLAPDVGALEALGAAEASALFEPRRLATGARAELVTRARGVEEWRVPLPGTPDAASAGRMPESPRGAGTGWLRLRIFASGATDALRLALTAPASTSPAAREWNLLCRLAAAGVGVPALVALVEQGARSCLVTRELAGYLPAPSWLGARDASERERGLASLRHALARLERSRVWLPGLTLVRLLLEDRPQRAAAEARADDCAAVTLARLAAESAATGELGARGLLLEPLPGVALASVAGGRLGVRRRTGWGALAQRLQQEARA